MFLVGLPLYGFSLDLGLHSKEGGTTAYVWN